MGLDQFAYAAARAGQFDEYWNAANLPDSNKVSEPQDLATWRKHPNLQGWMQRLWQSRGNTGDFNGDEVELTWEDLNRLEQDIVSGRMAQLGTRGFFFGDFADDYYREQDLEFIRRARAELFLGLRVFYNSSW